MKKKGEQSLQMIFGLFLLLIISLVVLAMFFKFVKKGGDSTTSVSQDYAKRESIERAKAECENLCTLASGDDSKIEFCSSIYEVDWDQDGSIEGPAQFGAWWFCEKKIPCFAIVPNCKNRYTGAYCRTLLAELAPNKYVRLFDDVENPGFSSIEGGCNLPTTNSDPAADGMYPTKYNWKERYCYDQDYCAVLGLQNVNGKCQNPLPNPFVCAGDTWN